MSGIRQRPSVVDVGDAAPRILAVNDNGGASFLS
jgi:hypothetical protein